MSNKDHKTEEKILDAANKIFVKNGFDGTRMQQIADEAKINKSLLHYYYRSKDKLFTQIFKIVSKKFFPQAIKIFSNDNIEFFDKIRIFSHDYINILSKNPFLPMFILHEISKNPQKISKLFDSLFDEIIDEQLNLIEKDLKIEFQKGNIIKINSLDFMVNLLSLCIFPFIGRPIITSRLMKNSSKEFNQYIEQRKTNVAEFFINSIKTK